MLSIVVPVYNEEESLRALCGELADVASDVPFELQVIFVDDGSTDRSWDVIRSLVDQWPWAEAIRLRRNFGKAAALSAGFRQARGDFVATMDADLQDDPHEIPRLLERLEAERLDVVSGWKQVRHDPWHKVIPSRIFNWMVGRLTGVWLHDHNCGLKVYRQQVLREVRLYGEMHRFVPVLAHARGFRVGEIAVHHRPRKYGYSKYGAKRFIKGFLDLLTVTFLTSFRHRPQHLLGSLGLLSFAAGGLGLVYLAGYWIVAQLRPDLGLKPLHQRPAVIYSAAALLLGAQLLSIGILAEMITARDSRESDAYSIAEVLPDEVGRIEPTAERSLTSDA